jgi:hypothetical protein
MTGRRVLGIGLDPHTIDFEMAGSLLGASRKVRVAQSERQNGLQPCDVVRPETRWERGLEGQIASLG